MGQVIPQWQSAPLRQICPFLSLKKIYTRLTSQAFCPMRFLCILVTLFLFLVLLFPNTMLLDTLEILSLFVLSADTMVLPFLIALLPSPIMSPLYLIILIRQTTMSLQSLMLGHSSMILPQFMT